MPRMFLLVALAVASAAPALASASSVSVRTIAVTPKVITAAPEKAPAHVRRPTVRRKVRAITPVRRVPRPLSPGEFGRPRHGA